ncbi:hypothetical protein [Kaistia sp. MMO-174]|uniref:hypothetical protein n=1 Tax=Kaistia sp. MMO-174 TaxID=3081256 RepID=UPI003016D00E
MSPASYAPCAVGLHVCGMSEDGTEAVTVLNIPTRTAAEAHRLFYRAKAECQIAGEEPRSLVVDLCLGANEHGADDFSMSRQMLDRLVVLAAQS